MTGGQVVVKATSLGQSANGPRLRDIIQIWCVRLVLFFRVLSRVVAPTTATATTNCVGCSWWDVCRAGSLNEEFLVD